MTTGEIETALAIVTAEPDPAARALLLAGLVSRLFREAGFDPVIVGGSAIEFYTDGAYMSGDIDVCWRGPRLPTPADQAMIVRRLHADSGGARTCRIAGLFVDLLTSVESYARTAFPQLATPLGMVTLLPMEDLLVERVFIARCWTGPNAEAEDCARKLLAVALNGGVVPVDWEEAERIASLPAYQCREEFLKLKAEVAATAAPDPTPGFPNL